MELASRALGVHTSGREGKEQEGTDREVCHSPGAQQLHLSPRRSPGARLALRVVLTWAAMARSLYSGIDQSLDVDYQGMKCDLGHDRLL